METFSALLALCAGNSLASGEFPAQRPVMRSFDVFCDFCLNKGPRKQSWGWRFETLLRPLWRHCNVAVQNLWVRSTCRRHWCQHLGYVKQEAETQSPSKTSTTITKSVSLRGLIHAILSWSFPHTGPGSMCISRGRSCPRRELMRAMSLVERLMRPQHLMTRNRRWTQQQHLLEWGFDQETYYSPLG